ncbi:MAG: hypothetical protein ACFFCD_15865 [Promethearchaeota archaeon]
MVKIEDITEFPTLFWILELYIPDYQNNMGNFELEGYILASSKQVWNLISTDLNTEETTVRSCLIGPSILCGSMQIGGRPIPEVKTIAGVIFDSTELRPNEPVPLVDIIAPDVIDPTATADEEQITREIRIIELARGQKMGDELLAKVQDNHLMPKKLLGNIVKRTFTVKTTSGVNNAKVCLGGLHRDKYRLFVDAIKSGKLRVPEGRPILDVAQKKIITFDRDNLSQYVIVELNPILDPSIDSFDQFVDLYHKTVEYMLSSEETYFWT